MSEKEKQNWAEKVGKEIEESKKIVEARMKEMIKSGIFKNELKDELTQEPDTRVMRWYNGGKF